MKKVSRHVRWFGLILVFPLGSLVQAQSNTLGSTMDVFVFPAEGQDSSQQSKDEATCYEWAVGNTGTDPFALAKQEQADQQQAQADMQAASQAGQGSGARGAVRGGQRRSADVSHLPAMIPALPGPRGGYDRIDVRIGRRPAKIGLRESSVGDECRWIAWAPRAILNRNWPLRNSLGRADHLLHG